MSSSLDPMPSLADLTYPRHDVKDNTLDDQDLDKRCPLDIGKHRLEPIFDLGKLERLPYELIAEILAQLDLRSLFDFRRVNQRAMQAVDGVSQFKQILKHNLTVVQAALAIQVGSYFSCIDLLRTLKDPNCEHCGDFAGYIYLLDCSRVCFLCFTQTTRYLPLSAEEVHREFNLDKSLLQGLPSIQSLAGRYSIVDTRCRKRLILYDYDSAHRAGVSLCGSQAAMMQLNSDNFSREMDEYKHRRRKYNQGFPGPRPRRPIKTAEEDDTHQYNTNRYMAVVHAPWISPKADTPVSGFHCVACQGQIRSRPLHWRRKFTDETFREHMRQCGSIRDGKHDSSLRSSLDDVESTTDH